MKWGAWWMISLVVVIIGMIFISISYLGAISPILSGYLQLISISTAAQNFIRNSMEFLKWLSGPGA